MIWFSTLRIILFSFDTEDEKEKPNDKNKINSLKIYLIIY